MSMFITTKVPAKTPEQKKVTRIANRISKATREARKSGPVFIVVKK